MQAGPLPGRAEVARALARVYARPEFAPQRTYGWAQRITDAWEAVKEFFARIADRLGVMQTAAPVLFWVIFGWMAITALAILAHLVYTVSQTWRARERDPAVKPLRSAAPRPVTAADWEAEARRAAAEGRLRDAAVAHYQALLLRLDARGVLRYDSSKTPGEYRREVRRDPAAGRAFGGFLRLFEPVAFGGRALDPTGYERLRAAAAEAEGRG